MFDIWTCDSDLEKTTKENNSDLSEEQQRTNQIMDDAMTDK